MLDWTRLHDRARRVIRTAEQITIHQAVAVVKPENCIGCDLCVPLGHCYAIQMVPAPDGVMHEKNKNGMVAEVDPYSCTGCHTCFDVCPTDCFIWVDVPEDRDFIPI